MLRTHSVIINSLSQDNQKQKRKSLFQYLKATMNTVNNINFLLLFIENILCSSHKHFQPTPVFLPGESCEQRSLEGCCLWGCTESDMTEATQHACVHWRRQWQPTPVFLPGESQGRGILVGCCLWGRTESDTTEVTQQQQQQQILLSTQHIIHIFYNSTIHKTQMNFSHFNERKNVFTKLRSYFKKKRLAIYFDQKFLQTIICYGQKFMHRIYLTSYYWTFSLFMFHYKESKN